MIAPTARTVLSFDFGLRRIGVAVGNTLTGTAEVLATIAAQDGKPDWRSIDRCVAEWRPAAIVAGVPYNMAGRNVRLATAALRFADAVPRSTTAISARRSPFSSCGVNPSERLRFELGLTMNGVTASPSPARPW